MAGDATQYISILIKNDMREGGNVTIRNAFSLQGEPYEKSEKSIITTEDVNHTVIPRGEEGTVSFCGSATYGLGIHGGLDLYHCGSRVASLHWNGPWARHGNQFAATDVDEKYLVIASAVPEAGVLGDVSVAITEKFPS